MTAQSDSGERVVLWDTSIQGRDVIVDGRLVPMLKAYPKDRGKVLLVFDRRLAVELSAANYQHVTAFVADVMENVMHPECGRTFNRIVEIGAVTRHSAPPNKRKDIDA